MEHRGSIVVIGLALVLATGCSRAGVGSPAESCMTCHNASQANDYGGPGIENPHPFPGAGNLRCSTCHGGNPQGEDKDSSHVPRPPQIGDDQNLIDDPVAYFNRLTLTGLDQYPPYTVNGTTWTALDYLQFVNPGDLRVVTQGRSCGICHQGHATSVAASPLATEVGILSGAMFAIGADNEVPESVGLHQDTAGDLSFRAVTDPTFPVAPGVGEVARLLEYPVFSVRGANGPDDIFQNNLYLAAAVNDDVLPDGRVVSNSALANLYHEQVAFTCGDCHLGSAGANNRYGDFRSSGCTACHMPYSLDGKSRSRDPNVDKLEPLDPDQILAPERSHVRAHLIVSTARQTTAGLVQGIDDYACAGCHQGSNRTVMQYWGIRLDQNEDLHRGVQYPAMPDSFTNTHDDPRLFDPVVDNNTFNGRRDRQYILEEDYDGDGRDDTPPDVHYEAGMGCIDCHGGNELHGGNVGAGDDPRIVSRMEQTLAIECESCHGGISTPAATTIATAWDGVLREVAVDSAGNPLPHVVKEGSDLFLYSRLTGQKHYVSQTVDTVFDSGVVNPFTMQPVYTDKASYAMGRADGVSATGIGPRQVGMPASGYAHTDNVSCAACHASWTNSCIGCHLEGEYRGGGNQFDFSNITGERIVFRERNADFVYQSPVMFQLGVDTDDKVAPIAANTDMFFQWEDRFGTDSDTFAFSDRNAMGANKAATAYPSLSHNVMMPHSIRGRVTMENEGPRYCVACHLTTSGMTQWGTEYQTLRNALSGGTPASLSNLNFTLLQEHIGENTGNDKNSPLWVHMVAGLGTGLFLFDEEGCPVNPLDGDANRKGCEDGAPSANFDLNDVVYDLDRIVLGDGTPTGSNNHPMDDPVLGATNRNGEPMAGPLGAAMIQRLTDPNPTLGIHLDSWLDANGDLGGQAGDFIP